MKKIFFDSDTLLDFEKALRKALKEAANGWSGWIVPIFAELEEWSGDNPGYYLKFSVGSLVSRNTIFRGDNVFNVEAWNFDDEEDDLDSRIDCIVNDFSGSDDLPALYDTLRFAFSDFELIIK